MKILFFGDIVAKLGRKALTQILPDWLKQYQPDVVIGNIENLAHGNGFTSSTIKELQSLGFNGFTSGDHAFKQPEAISLMQDKSLLIARPANFSPQVPGQGYIKLSVGTRELIVINLIGRVFMDEHYDCPFRTADKLLEEINQLPNIGGIIVDIHAEATSEKIALGWYLDGRVSAVVGTHTHIVTADEWVLPKGTAYISDVGMTGGKEGVIGVNREIIIKRFLDQMPAKFDPVEDGLTVVQAVLLDVDSSTKAKSIIRLSKEITV
ncbi:MAG: TIGR00282 family metallophosphoesterase [Patescibacteria group bacterium]